MILGLAAPFSLFFATAALASAPGANSATAQDLDATAQTYVEHSLRVWQQRLNLTDWNVKVELLPASQLEPKTLGNIHWDRNSKVATIAVLCAHDYTLPLHDMLEDMELTIVHELVHLHLASLPHTPATTRSEEYAVNQLSHALLDLERHPRTAAAD
jgi:hypothetical protein